MTVRTNAMEAAYQKARASGTLKPLHEEDTIKDFRYWKVVNNRFPHDKLNTKHMIIVLREPDHNIWEIQSPALEELWYVILPYYDDKLDYVKINFAAMRSINNVPHIHICDHKEEYR